MSREVTFQDELKELLKSASRGARFDGLEISRVERDYPVDRKKTDIAVFLKGEVPFVFIETKKKVERPGYRRARRFFHPMGQAVVGQAISYAALYLNRYGQAPPYFATANPTGIAVFRTPEHIREFIYMDRVDKGEYDRVFKPGKFAELIRDYLIVFEDLELNKEYIQTFLDRLAKDYQKKYILKVSPSWALIGYLRKFVEGLTSRIKRFMELKIKREQRLKEELEKMKREMGYKPDSEQLVKMMSYVLMDKIIFYKILEAKYKLPKLIGDVLDKSSSSNFMKQLNGFFEEAILVTKDFEPIFRTGIYDMMFLPDEEEVMEYIADFIDTLERINVLELGDFAGYIYEELIPDEERHQLGQFYTPPAITELITRWAIRSQEDVILDPGVGSGTFLLWAYKVLLKLKTGRDELPAPRDVHEKILNQLYAIDINPFPAHLTTMNLAMRNVRAPFENMNVIVDDFFRVRPGETYLLRVKTPKGEEVRSVSLPKSFNAVVGNPPYTRWVEIPEPTQNLILDPNDELRDEISKYGLTPQVRRGIEPGIYIYWIMHAAKFLKNGGRLGMIISNMWLQTDYGVKFGNFLLDNFKIEAVIDFSARLFRIPLIATCVILLEKCEDEEERKKNEAIFMFIDKEAKVDEILEALQEPEKFTNKFLINVVKQENIPRDDKWISLLFNPDEILDLLIKNPLMVKMSELFEPSRGNTTFSMWAIRHGRRPDLGAKDFFYFNESKAKEYGIGDDFLEPAITGARQVKYFTFTEKDWKTLRTGDKNCYLFICHKPREELPDSVKKYIELGEPICPICGKKFKEPKIDSEGFFTCVNGHRISGSEKIITLIPKTRGGGTIASEAIACKTREKEKKYFYGWYDLGGFKYAPIMAIYQSQYKTRFFYCKHPVATYHAIITFIPKVDLNETQIKALLAYLNSSFTQLYVEKNARTTGGGIAALEVDYAQSIPVIDVRELDDTYLNKLASLFDKLEKEARRLGDAAKKENVEKLWDSIILEIDNVVEEILKLPSGVGSIAKNIAMEMMERRVARTKGARPEAVKGEETPVVKPKKKKSRKKKKEASTPLNKWMK